MPNDRSQFAVLPVRRLPNLPRCGTCLWRITKLELNLVDFKVLDTIAGMR